MGGPRVIWIVVTLLLIVATQGTVMAVRARNEPRIVRELKHDVEELPSTIGDWQQLADGEIDSSIEEGVLRQLRSDEAMTRNYVHSNGRTCSVHIAVWRDPEEWTPHPPELCYKGAGFAQADKSLVDLPGRDKQQVRLSAFVASNTGQQVAVIYWYQIGGRTYVDRDSGRAIRRGLWGSSERPPMVKVLLQSTEIMSDDDQQHLLDLASQIHKFTGTL